MDAIDTILLGRVTYSMFAEYWPIVTEGGRAIRREDQLDTEVVFSGTLDRAPWGKWDEARIVKRPAAEEVRKLKQ